MDSFDISASALSAQRLRMDIISSNLANVNTTRKADGTLGAYRRKNVVFAPLLAQKMNTNANTLPMKQPSMYTEDRDTSVEVQNGQIVLKATIGRGQKDDPSGVHVVEIAEDENTPLKMVYDPSHPDAGEDGYVRYPNVNPVMEMVDMIAASRAYEANVQALQSTKSMGKAALEI